MTRRQALKSEIKELALQIKTRSRAFRDAQRANSETWKLRGELGTAQYEFRHKHITASLFRGRTRDQIEQPKPENKPNEKYIAELIAAYTEVISEEAICAVSV